MKATAFFVPLLFALVACDTSSESQAFKAARSVATADTDAAHRNPSGIPVEFLGIWDAHDGVCLDYSDMRLTVMADRLEFYESNGIVTGLSREGTAIIVDLAMSGEGETWLRRERMVLRNNGTELHLTDANSANPISDYPRTRCPA